jgi:hypothetical protein
MTPAQGYSGATPPGCTLDALGVGRAWFHGSSVIRMNDDAERRVVLFNTKNGSVEKRFHERMTGGEAQDLLDTTERAAGELFPDTRRTGTASRRKSVLTSESRPVFAENSVGQKHVESQGFSE